MQWILSKRNRKNGIFDRKNKKFWTKFKKSNGIQNDGNIKGEIENAVDNIKEVEMKQNVFQNSNINQQFQRINSTLENHEGRIGVLEGTVAKHGEILANHEGRIGKLENTVDQHSKKIWKYC